MEASVLADILRREAERQSALCDDGDHANRVACGMVCGALENIASQLDDVVEVDGD